MLSFVTIAWASLIAASVSAFNHQTHFHGTPPAVVPIPPISAERGHWVRDLAERWDLGNLGVVGVRAGSKGEWTFVSMITHGNRSLDEDGPLHENHTFAIASNSKVITGIALSLLMEDLERAGRTLPNGETLSFKSRMRDILPDEWKLQDQYVQEHATLDDVLSMHWGMPRHDNAHKFEPCTSFATIMPHVNLSAELRQTWQYQNGGYNLVPLVFHHLLDPESRDTIKPFKSYVQERLFDGIGLASASYDFETARLSGSRVEGVSRMHVDFGACRRELQARKHNKWETKGRPIPKSCLGEPVGIGAFTELGTWSDVGAGGVIMDMWTMAFWVWRLLDPFDWLAPHVKKVTTPISLVAAEPPPSGAGLKSHTLYGIGQKISTYRGATIHEHTGGVPGQSSWLVRLPEKGVGLWLQSGDPQHGVNALQAIGWTIIDDWLEVPESERVDWEEQLLIKPLAEPPEQTGLPSAPVEAPSDGSITGQYYNEGYGPLALHKLNTFEEQPPDFHLRAVEAGGPLKMTHMARSCLADEIDHGTLNVTEGYFAELREQVFATHIAFTPWSGRIFNWTTLSIYPREVRFKAPDSDTWSETTVGGKRLAAAVDETGSAVITDKGIGMFGGFWGSEPTLSRWPDRRWESEDGEDEAWIEQVKARAEVWFERTHSSRSATRFRQHHWFA